MQRVIRVPYTTILDTEFKIVFFLKNYPKKYLVYRVLKIRDVEIGLVLNFWKIIEKILLKSTYKIRFKNSAWTSFGTQTGPNSVYK